MAANDTRKIVTILRSTKTCSLALQIGKSTNLPIADVADTKPALEEAPMAQSPKLQQKIPLVGGREIKVVQ
jgi:hypothetical protein